MSATALDFRDIHQHPPDATKLREPLPPDPSWDAHKVYFNERERDIPQKGDEFDDFFVMASPEEQARAAAVAVLEVMKGDDDEEDNKDNKDKDTKEKNNSTISTNLPKNDDGTLDPLGWPVDEFRSMGGHVVQSLHLPNNNDNNNNYHATNNAAALANDDDDDDDGDDLNLLRKSDDDDVEPPSVSTTATLLSSLGMVDHNKSLANEMVDGIQSNVLSLGGAVTSSSNHVPQDADNANEAAAIEKEERIRIYETTGVDDESSVEEEDGGEYDDEEWEEGREVGYIAQSASLDEMDNDIGLLGTSGVSGGGGGNDNPHVTKCNQPMEPESGSVVPTFKVPTTTRDHFKAKSSKGTKKGNNKNNSKGTIPFLLPPPPAEKLQKWEESKAKTSTILATTTTTRFQKEEREEEL